MWVPFFVPDVALNKATGSYISQAQTLSKNLVCYPHKTENRSKLKSAHLR